MRFISENILDNRPVWLSIEEADRPGQIIQEFVKDNELSACRYLLWQMFSRSISSGEDYPDASTADQIYFFENLVPFIEAVYLTCVEGKSLEYDHQEQVASDPFKAFAIFLDYMPPSDFRERIADILQAAYATHVYENPADVVSLFENLNSLINAAHLLHLWKDQDWINLSELNQFDSLPVASVECEKFPRTLTRAEIKKPRIAVTGFFNFKTLAGWKKELKGLQHFALCKESVLEGSVWVDSLSVYTHLVKLVEAVDLIHRTKGQKSA